MTDLFDTDLKEKYRQYFVKDILAFAKDAIDWTVFPHLVKVIYQNDTDRGERPYIPVITIVKVLYLHSLYKLADKPAENENRDRISFMNFLDYPLSCGIQSPQGTSGRDCRRPDEIVQYRMNCRASLN